MATPSAARARLQATAAWAGTLFLYWRIGGVFPAAAAVVAGALALLAWTNSARYAPVQRTLDRVLHFLLAGLTWVLLAVLYLVLFTPMRLWRGLVRRDPLQRRFDPAATTYLQSLPPPAPGRFDRQF